MHSITATVSLIQTTALILVPTINNVYMSNEPLFKKINFKFKQQFKGIKHNQYPDIGTRKNERDQNDP